FKVKLFNRSSAQTATIALNSAQPFPVGAYFDVAQTGAGALTVAAASGVTIDAPLGLVFPRQFAMMRFVQVAVDHWMVGWASGEDGGGAPTGSAGGVLAGTYPNPSFAVDMATQ